MKFSDICIITTDVVKVREFYERVFDVEAEGDDTHSFMRIAGLGLAIYNKANAKKDMGLNLEGSGTGLITIGFNASDAEAEYYRIIELGIENVTKPVVWPWGVKSFNFTDTEGNIIVIRSWPDGDDS